MLSCVSTAFLNLLLAVPVLAAPTNITVTVSPGTSNHGDPKLLCTSLSWTGVVIFFLGNYVAHAATVLNVPGQTKLTMLQERVLALLFPAFGLQRGLSTISTFASFGKSKLEVAKRSGVLCMLARAQNWRPMDGDIVDHATVIHLGRKSGQNEGGVSQVPKGDERAAHANEAVSNVDRTDLSNSSKAESPINVSVYDLPFLTNAFGIGRSEFLAPRDIHGNWNYPSGYKIIFVPYDAVVEPLEYGESCSMSCDNGYMKRFIALGQVLFAIATLYESQGDQLSRFGYVSFSLTVIPYAVMSITNLIGSLCRPEFPENYVVESKILEEARRRGAKFRTVGRLVEEVSSSASEGSNVTCLSQPARFYAENNEDELRIDLHPLTHSSNVSKPISETVKELKNKPEEEVIISSNFTKLPGEVQTLQLSKTEINYNAAENTESPTLLVPATNLFRRVHTRKFTNDYEFEQAEWNEGKGWDVSFMNETVRNQRGILIYGAQLVIAGIPFAIIGALSRYRPGSSTYSQRVWIMAWMCMGQGYFLLSFIFVGLPFSFVQFFGVERAIWMYQFYFYFLAGLLSVPAIGGMVVVALMMKSYGSCVSLS